MSLNFCRILLPICGKCWPRILKQNTRGYIEEYFWKISTLKIKPFWLVLTLAFVSCEAKQIFQHSSILSHYYCYIFATQRFCLVKFSLIIKVSFHVFAFIEFAMWMITSTFLGQRLKLCCVFGDGRLTLGTHKTHYKFEKKKLDPK